MASTINIFSTTNVSLQRLNSAQTVRTCANALVYHYHGEESFTIKVVDSQLDLHMLQLKFLKLEATGNLEKSRISHLQKLTKNALRR